MEGHSEKTKYLSLCFLQEVLFCLINIFLAFSKFFKRIFLYLIHSNEYHESTFVYHFFKTVDIPSSCTTDIDQDLFPESYDVHDHTCEKNETKFDLVSYVLNHEPSKIKERYKPLRFPYPIH